MKWRGNTMDTINRYDSPSFKILFLLLGLPVGLTLIAVMLNSGFILNSQNYIPLNKFKLISNWAGLYLIIWGVSGFFTVVFYIHLMFPLNFTCNNTFTVLAHAVLFFITFFITIFTVSGNQFKVLDSLDIEDTSYHIARASNGVYIFECDEDICNFKKIVSFYVVDAGIRYARSSSSICIALEGYLGDHAGSFTVSLNSLIVVEGDDSCR
jgi:hypothetical protein